QAHRISTRYREDPRMRGLVQTVLPVAGLLGEAATSLGPDEYADLRTLAGLAEGASRLMLVSATRFVTMPGVPLPPDRRHRRLRIGAHELAGIGVRTELRTGQVPAAPEQLAPMDRLLGGDGSAATVRLGLPPDATREQLDAAIAGLHGYWRRVARSALTEPPL